MGRSKEWFLRMREEDYLSLTTEQRSLFTYAECRESDEWENNKDDENYLRLKSKEKQAKKAVQEYLFNKRHKK